MSVWFTTFNPLRSLLPNDVEPSLLAPVRLEGLWLLALARELDLEDADESFPLTKLLTLTTLT